MARQVVGSMSDWAGMLSDFFRQIKDGSIQQSQMQAILEHRNPFAIDVPALLADWQAFYKDLFSIELDFSNLVVPDYQQGFDRLLVVAQGMTPQRLYDKCKELFPCWKWTKDNLDNIVQSDRTAKDSHYAVWVRNKEEADEELKSLSANQLKEQKVPCITLEERELYELKFFKETGSHLDRINWTLCSGSFFSGGSVPDAFWCGGFRVDWCYSYYACSLLRARAVVSLV